MSTKVVEVAVCDSPACAKEGKLYGGSVPITWTAVDYPTGRLHFCSNHCYTTYELSRKRAETKEYFELQSLCAKIWDHIKAADTTNVLSADRKKELAKDLGDFVAAAIEKYIKGQLEHGGHIEDRDLDKEIKNEVIDLLFYSHANTRKHKRLLQQAGCKPTGQDSGDKPVVGT